MPPTWQHLTIPPVRRLAVTLAGLCVLVSGPAQARERPAVAQAEAAVEKLVGRVALAAQELHAKRRDPAAAEATWAQLQAELPALRKRVETAKRRLTAVQRRQLDKLEGERTELLLQEANTALASARLHARGLQLAEEAIAQYGAELRSRLDEAVRAGRDADRLRDLAEQGRLLVERFEDDVGRNPLVADSEDLQASVDLQVHGVLRQLQRVVDAGGRLWGPPTTPLGQLRMRLDELAADIDATVAELWDGPADDARVRAALTTIQHHINTYEQETDVARAALTEAEAKALKDWSDQTLGAAIRGLFEGLRRQQPVQQPAAGRSPARRP